MKGFRKRRIFEETHKLASERRDVGCGGGQNTKAKRKAARKAERSEDKREEFHVTEVEGLKGKMEKKKKKRRF